MNRYTNIENGVSESGKVFKRNAIYPSIPPTADDLYIISTVGDRYDILALKFYGDPKLWWIIASANNFNKTSLVLEPGVQIRIPANKQKAIELFNSVNSSR